MDNDRPQSTDAVVKMREAGERVAERLHAENNRLREALRALITSANQSLGLIVEFGDLNGFRNTTNEELGRLVITTAKSLAEAITAAEAAADAE